MVFVVAGLYLRVVLPFDSVFGHGLTKFNSNDAYYFMRQVDTLVHNFPNLISVDTYLEYPTVSSLGVFNFFVYLLSGAIKLIGLGSPSQHLVDTVGAYFPAILGLLTIVPVYFIGRGLFGRWAGIVAAGLVAILPGEFLGRTILGSTDRDALEVLLSALTMLFLILAVKMAREKALERRSPGHLRLADLRRPIVFSVMSGISLGLYLLTWRGAFLFVLIIMGWFVLQSVVDHLKRRPFGHIGLVGAVTLLTALFVFGSMSQNLAYSAALSIPLVLTLALLGLGRGLSRMKTRPVYYPVIVLGAGLLGLGILYAASPSSFSWLWDQFSVFVPNATGIGISELQPSLFDQGRFSLAIIWGSFTTSFFLGMVSLGVLIYLSLKRTEADTVLFVFWSGVMLVATLILRRMALLFAINVTILTGYLATVLYRSIQLVFDRATGRSINDAASRLLESGGSTVAAKPSSKPSRDSHYEALGVRRDATPKQIKKAYQTLVNQDRARDGGAGVDEARSKRVTDAYSVLSDRRKRAAFDQSTHDRGSKKARVPTAATPMATGWARTGLAAVVIFFLVFFPNFKWSITTVHQQSSFAPSDSWQDSLRWLRDNSPEPFGQASFYYDLYQLPFHYPDTSYGVAAWWDYGYWITRIARRLPNAHPGGGSRELVARMFTAQDEASAGALTDQMGSRYLMVDEDTVKSKFYAVAAYAGSSSDQYSDQYYMDVLGRLVPVEYYYPEYYRSLAVRLFYFNGEEVPSQGSTVISFVELPDRGGHDLQEDY